MTPFHFACQPRGSSEVLVRPLAHGHTGVKHRCSSDKVVVSGGECGQRVYDAVEAGRTNGQRFIHMNNCVWPRLCIGSLTLNSGTSDPVF